MTIHIGECPLGVFAFDDKGEMIGSRFFPKKVRKIAERLSLAKEEKSTPEHEEIFKELYDQGHREFTIASKGIASQLQDKFKDSEIDIEVPNKANKILRESISELAEKFEFGDPNKLIRDVNLIMIRKELRHKASERDKIVIEAVNVMDELDKTINTLYGRIREWYGIHFPELEQHITDYSQYFELVKELGSRENFTKSALTEAGIQEETADEIASSAENSIGAEFDEVDINALQKSIEKIQGLYEAREHVEEYLDGLMSQIAPNLQTLAGSPIGARLISLAGGLKKLSRMPASTIQVLGAEKALFRALQKGAKPPKHGVIYQYPEIRGSPRKQRGKISRALSGKISIAVRVDAMSGEFVGEDLKEDLEKRIASIKSKSGD